MPVTATHIETDGSLTNATSYQSVSTYSPTANRLQLVAVASQGVSGTPQPTVSGHGLTYTAVRSVIAFADYRLSVFSALGAAPFGAKLAIDFGASTMLHCSWSISEFANTTGTVVQSNDNNATSGTILTVTLAAFANANNATYGAFSMIGTAVTPGSGFTELGEKLSSDGGVGWGDDTIETEWRNDNDTTVDASWTGSARNQGIAVEIEFGTPPAPPDDPGHQTLLPTVAPPQPGAGIGPVGVRAI